MGTTLKFSSTLTKSDPQSNPVLIVGQTRYLNQLTFDDVKLKLEPRVSAEIFNSAVSNLRPSPTDSCPLWMNNATIAALPTKCSRHNTPTRAHSLSKIVKSCMAGGDEFIVLVCERRDAFASAGAIARSLPLFSAKSNADQSVRTVTVEFILTGDDKGEVLTDSDVECLNVIAESTRLSAKIVDMPCDMMHTDAFIQEIKNIGNELNIEPTIIRGEELNKRGFGGLYGVGKAAVHPPALVILSHKPPGATKNIAWVGKGIVFDTGGLCIKAKASMCGMKRDCGGAAAILGAFYTAVKMGFTENLHGLFCLAENAVGQNACRPDDVLTLYSGRTVEINNTDAEGRLVLGDGVFSGTDSMFIKFGDSAVKIPGSEAVVAYAHKDLEADVIVDMATLTGAQGIATDEETTNKGENNQVPVVGAGLPSCRYHGSIVTNNEDIELACVKAGQNSGDLVHAMPFSPELHFNEFASVIADMKNSVADRSNAQVSCAGLFIFSHLGFDFPGIWLHVDMASPAHMGERATGYGVALLNTLFGKSSSNSLLQSIAPAALCNGMETDNEQDTAKKMRVI